jgi:hypothetical protein
VGTNELIVQNNFYFSFSALQNRIVDKPNRIVKANGGKKKPVKPKRKKGFVYYGGYEDRHAWEPYGDRTSEGWLDWEERGWGWVMDLNKYLLAFRFCEGAEKYENSENRDVVIFKTRFFESDHYKTLCSWLDKFYDIAKSAKEAGLFNDSSGKLITKPIDWKVSNDDTQNYANIVGMLSSLRMFAASHTFLVLKFSDLYNEHIAGLDMRKLWVCQKFRFGEDVPIKDAQKALDWFYKHESYYLELIKNLDWLVDEIGIASANATAFGYGNKDRIPEDAPWDIDEREYQIQKFRDYVDQDKTIPYYTSNYYKNGVVRVFSIALASYLDGKAAHPLYARTNVLGGSRDVELEVQELITKILPEAKRLLKNVHISKWKDMLEFCREGFDSVSYKGHLKNFNDFDALESTVEWVEDRIYSIGFWEGVYDETFDHQTRAKFGDFLELIERIKSWAIFENEGALAQLQGMYFRIKEKKAMAPIATPNDEMVELPKKVRNDLMHIGAGKVIERTAKAKLWGQDDQSLLERLTNLIETVSDTYAGCSLGDVMVVWVGDYQRRSGRAKMSPPSADKLRNVMTRKEESPYAKITNSWGRQTLLHPTWQSFVKIWPTSAIKTLNAQVKEEGASGAGKKVQYFQHHGQVAFYAKSKQVAEFLINHFGNEHMQTIVENRETRLAAKSAQKKSAS